MMKSTAIVFASFAACAYGAMAMAATAQVTVAVFSPAAAAVGSQVTITGAAFTASANTVVFEAEALSQGDWPTEPGIVPDQLSADGRTIVFTVPERWRPACSYLPQAPCPFASIRTVPGTYRVSVRNANGASTARRFTVTP